MLANLHRSAPSSSMAHLWCIIGRKSNICFCMWVISEYVLEKHYTSSVSCLWIGLPVFSDTLRVSVQVYDMLSTTFGRSIWQHHWLWLACPDSVQHQPWSIIFNKDVSNNESSLVKFYSDSCFGRRWTQQWDIWSLWCHRLSWSAP